MLTGAFVSPIYHQNTFCSSTSAIPYASCWAPAQLFRPKAMPPLVIEPARRAASISPLAAAKVEPLTQNDNNADHKTTASSSHEEDVYSDIRMSILSNAFFLSGGIVYIVGTCWDWILQGASPLHFFSYQLLWLLGPLIYLLNAAVDVTWAVRFSRREKRRRALLKVLKLNGSTSSGLGSASTSSSSPKIKIRAKRNKFIRRIRRHFGHRRELSAALSFGVAASCGVVASLPSLLQLYGGDVAVKFSAASVHLYLVSAVCSVCGRRSTPTPSAPSATALPWLEDAQTLESIGDAFFFIAAMVDVVLADFAFDDAILAWPIASSLLWFADALLYLRADFVSLYDTNRREEIQTINQLFDGFDDCEGPESPKYRVAESMNFVYLDETPDIDTSRRGFV